MAVVGPGPGAKSVDDLTFDLSFTLLFCKEYIAYNRDFNQNELVCLAADERVKKWGDSQGHCFYWRVWHNA